MYKDNKIIIHRYASGIDPYYIEAVVTFVGQNISVTIGGGSKYHIGAIAIAIPSDSIINPGQITVSTSVITVMGHKDDVLAKDVATKLAKHFNTTVTVTAGVHVDSADSVDIETLLTNSNLLVDKIIQD